MFSPGACTRRVGIYFPGGHVLLFGIIKKNSRPQHVLTGRLPSRDRIWHVYYYLRVATTTTTSRVRTEYYYCTDIQSGRARALYVPAPCRHGVRTRTARRKLSPGTWSGTKF